jgi:hypothetical protein
MTGRGGGGGGVGNGMPLCSPTIQSDNKGKRKAALCILVYIPFDANPQPAEGIKQLII